MIMKQNPSNNRTIELNAIDNEKRNCYCLFCKTLYIDFRNELHLIEINPTSYTANGRTKFVVFKTRTV